MDTKKREKAINKLMKETDMKIDLNKKERHLIYIEFANKYRDIWNSGSD